MFFGHRFGVDFGWVLGGFWETKNFDFGSFFEQKWKAKKHDVMEGPKKPSRRGKKQSQRRLTPWGGDRGDTYFCQAACWGVWGATTN